MMFISEFYRYNMKVRKGNNNPLHQEHFAEYEILI